MGTDIAHWFTKGDGTSQNLHIYYTPATSKVSGSVSVNGVNNSHTGDSSNPVIRTTVNDVTGSVKIRLNSKGLYINDALVSGFDGSNDIIKYLVGSADNIQVGSCEGENRSYATYNELTVTSTAAATSTACLLYTSPSPRDRQKSRMPSSA